MNNYEILCDYFLLDILKYLNLRELARIREVSRMFNDFIEVDDGILYENIEISMDEDYTNNSILFYEWLSKILKRSRIKKLDLLFCKNIKFARDILLSVNESHLTCLKIFTTFFSSESDLLKFTNLKKLSIKNMFFNESDIDQNLYAILNVTKMPWIKELKMNNIKFIKSIFTDFLENKFTKLDFKESADFTIDYMIPFIFNHVETLKILRLDAEYSSEELLIKSLIKLENLTDIYLGYCQNFSDDIMSSVSKISHRLTKLSMRKLRVSADSLITFFEKSDLSNLMKIDFYDCPNINDSCVYFISEKCLDLEYLDVSWSTEVKDNSIFSLMRNCLKLNFLHVQGCKYLTDKIFSFNCTSCLTSLRLIDCSKCDLIQDSTINKILLQYPCLSIINYYGIDMREFLNDN